ncbi:MAG: 3-dehydroquinate synthase [Lentisphaerae bacterium]|nr:3-dehydroquinate synthase [Lentisphaerota bacterium]
MKTVRVELGERGYTIRIGPGAAPGEVLRGAPGTRALVVSDTNVDPLYGARCEAALRDCGARPVRHVVPAGEPSKCWKQVAGIYERALEAGLDRRSVMVALGGGVVGDLAGFAAATYMRGIAYLQAPTTLLAMVDSAVGGKTGINLERGKNLVGAFHQPSEVAADPTVLETLPAREYAAGLAEVVKYGVIWDAPFFARLEAAADALAARDAAVLSEVMARCCEIKAEVVAMDERESGVRAILNFGHTLGHALEAASGYGRWLHGEAVALGMVLAGALSVREKGFDPADQRRLAALLRRFGLPTALPAADAPAWEAVRTALRADKKSVAGAPRFVLAERLGRVVFGCETAEQTVEEVYRGGGE